MNDVKTGLREAFGPTSGKHCRRDRPQTALSASVLGGKNCESQESLGLPALSLFPCLPMGSWGAERSLRASPWKEKAQVYRHAVLTVD